MAMSRDEIFGEVQEVLVDALGVDDDEVTNEATLMGDLGAESIDFLDIVFRGVTLVAIIIPRTWSIRCTSIMYRTRSRFVRTMTSITSFLLAFLFTWRVPIHSV